MKEKNRAIYKLCLDIQKHVMPKEEYLRRKTKSKFKQWIQCFFRNKVGNLEFESKFKNLPVQLEERLVQWFGQGSRTQIHEKETNEITQDMIIYLGIIIY